MQRRELTIIKRPSADANPGLQPRFSFFHLGESTQKRASILVHRDNLERSWIEENESEIHMREPIKIKILGRDFTAWSGIRPRLIVTNISLVDAATIFATGWLFDRPTASKSRLAASITEIVCRATKAELRTAYIQWAALFSRSSELTTFCFSIAV